ncbi:MAG: hypothetical protein DHS20C08_09680 [Rhodomicrobium sp.]|nr:MAG: hypothetical protein DHS20C08_09680 [Rhodomicrobium sp.]
MTEVKLMNRKEELVALLPFYLSDTLEPSERRAVDDWLARDPDAPALLEKIAEERFASSAANEDIKAPKGGLERLMADIAVTRQEASVQGVGARFGRWLETTVLAPARAAPQGLAWAACALLMVVTVSQSLMLYKAETGGAPSSAVVLAGGEKAALLSSALVQFSETAKMADVATLLDEAGAVILSGPTASGQFTIGFVEREGASPLAARQKLLSETDDLVSLFIVTDAVETSK